MTMPEERNLLYYPQEIVYNSTVLFTQTPFTVNHFTGNLYDQTKSKVQSLMDLKTKLLNWLKPMGIVERQQKFTFISRDFVNIVRKIYKLRCYNKNSVFRLIQNYQNNTIQVISKQGAIDMSKKSSTLAQEVKHNLIQNLLPNIIFFHKQQPFDAISFKEQSLQNIEQLFEIFSHIVDGIRFEISQEDCLKLQSQKNQKFFYNHDQTPHYLQSLGKLLVSVFTQQLCCQFYKSMRNKNIKKSKDKNKKKIANLWRVSTLQQKKNILQIQNPNIYFDKLELSVYQTPRRVQKQWCQGIINQLQIISYLKIILEIPFQKLYDNVKICTLFESHKPEGEIKWFVFQQIRQFMIKKAQLNQIKQLNLFMNDKQKKRKLSNNLIKEKNNQTKSEVEKYKQQQKIVQLKSSVKTKIQTQCSQSYFKTKSNKNFNKHAKTSHKKKNHNNKHGLKKQNQGDFNNKSKQQTLASSRKNSQCFNEQKIFTSQSDVQNLVETLSLSVALSEKIQKYQKDSLQFRRHSTNIQNTKIFDIFDDEEHIEHVFESQQCKLTRRQNQVKTLSKNILNQFIGEYVRNLKQQASKFQYSRVVAFNRLIYLFSSLRVGMNIFGSCATGFVLKDSDIDLAIQPSILNYFNSSFGTTQDKIASALYFLKSIVQCRSWVKVDKLLDKAQVPVLKFTIDTSLPFQQSSDFYYNVPATSLSNIITIDLTIQQFQSEQKSHFGIPASNLMNKWKQMYPSLFPICLTLKYLLRKKNMGDAYKGGLNPYCVMIMLVAFLRYSNLCECTDVGEVLIQFLYFYSEIFNFKKICIDVSDQKSNPFLSCQQSDKAVIIQPISKKVFKFPYLCLPQVLLYFKQLRILLLDSTQFLSSFLDPATKLPEKLQYNNPLLIHFPIDLI